MAMKTKEEEADTMPVTLPDVVAEVTATVLVKIHEQVMEVTEEAFGYLCAWLTAIPTLGIAFHQWVVDTENEAVGAWKRVIPAEHAVTIEVEKPAA